MTIGSSHVPRFAPVCQVRKNQPLVGSPPITKYMGCDRTVTASVILLDGQDVLCEGLQLKGTVGENPCRKLWFIAPPVLFEALTDPFSSSSSSSSSSRQSPLIETSTILIISNSSPSPVAMRRRSIQSSSSSRHLDPPTNPHPRRALDWVPIIWHRIRALLQVLVVGVLRKFWGSFRSRPGSTSNREPAVDDHNNTSMGDLDCLPTDVFVQVLKLLGPKEAARSGLVCKSWKVLVSENRLWVFFLTHGKHPFDTVVFAETHLTSGPM
ncbi:hypothetical protein GW17_00016818 [Ensete ventricosum]|nr:hypothetical protein GW17_00016818 [Ensete ventricosum]